MSKILIITAHPDDLEFGMGGTLARLNSEPGINGGTCYNSSEHEFQIHVFSDSADIKGNAGIQQEVFDSIHGIFNLDCTVHKYGTMHFQENYQAIRDDIFRIKSEFDPDVVYCKSPNAIHPDHKVIGDACESIFLECSVYAMEGIRDGTNQVINKWCHIAEEELGTKIKAIGCYKSQQYRPYHDVKIVEAMARFRGNQVGLEFAEGFEIIREVR